MTESAVINAERHILVVPDRFTLSAEKKVMQAINKTAVFNIEVLTVSRLCNSVLSQFSTKYLTDSGALMLIRKIILNSKEKLVCFKRATHNAGFAQTIFESILQFKRSDILPEGLVEIINTTSDSALKLKLNDLYLIYSEYEKELETNYFDRSAKMNTFIREINKSKNIINSHIYFAEFDSFSSQDYRLITELIKASKSFNIACYASDYSNSSTINSDVLAKVTSVAQILDEKVNIIKFSAPQNAPFKHLSSNLFAYPFKKQELTYGAINLYESEDSKDEITFVARQIRTHILSGNARYKDFAVLCGGFSKYEKIIEETFNKFEIPYFLDKSENLQSHVLSRFLISALDVIKSNFQFADVMTYIKNYFFDITSAEKEHFENYCLQFGIKHNKFCSFFTLGEKEASFLVAEQVRKKLIRSIMPLNEKLKSSFSANSFVETITQFIKVNFLYEKLAVLCEEYFKNSNLTQQKISEQVPEKLSAVLSEFSDILSEQNISLDEAYAIFNMGLASSSISIVPIAIDCVFVGDISISMPSECDYEFIVGCNINQVPALKEDSGVITDSEIMHIKDLEPSVKYINSRERFKIHSILHLVQGL